MTVESGSSLAPVAIGPGATARTLPRWLIVLMLGLLAVAWLGTLGHRSLIHPDEGRYASLALGMAQSGDWVTPRLNGLLYFEKPALPYWLGALSFDLFGVSEWSARLWPGLAGLLTVLLVGYTGARLWGREAGLRALAIAASMTWIVLNSQFLSLDAGLNFFLTITLCSGLIAPSAPTPDGQRRWMLLAWAGIAGAVLSKGLVGAVIPACALMLASLWDRDLGVWRRLHPWRGIALLLAITVPWFALVSWRNPDFAPFFFIHEHFARYLSTTHRREGGWWYFIPLLLVGMLPWTSALPVLGRGAATTSPSDPDRSIRRLLVCWAAFVFVFFSLSGSKLPSYILPMFPALALLTARAMRDVDAQRLRPHLLLVAALWAALLALSFVLPSRLVSAQTPMEALVPLMHSVRVAGIVFLAGAAAAGWWLWRHRNVTAAVVCVATAHLAAVLLIVQSHDGFGQLKSAEPIAAVLKPLLRSGTPVYAVRSYDQTLPFYLGRPVVLVDYIDEFALGQQREPDKWVPTLDAFVERWRAAPEAAAYMATTTWEELRGTALPMRVVYQDPRRVVVVKP